MTNLKQSSPAKWLSIGLLIPGAVGLFDATYLTSAHYTGRAVTCSFLGGCEQVTTSQYATIFGIPVALIGALYYLAVMLLILAYHETKQSNLLKLIAALTGAGFLFSLWFVYLQAFVIKALCLYCLISAASSTILFLISLYLIKPQRSAPISNLTQSPSL